MCKVWKSSMSICNLANDQMLFIHAQREFLIDSSLQRERDRHVVCMWTIEILQMSMKYMSDWVSLSLYGTCMSTKKETDERKKHWNLFIFYAHLLSVRIMAKRVNNKKLHDIRCNIWAPIHSLYFIFYDTLLIENYDDKSFNETTIAIAVEAPAMALPENNTRARSINNTNLKSA